MNRLFVQMARKQISLAMLVLAATAAPASHAGLLAYDFTVTATTGPLAGVSSSGSFSFDESIVPVGGGALSETGLLTGLQFAWNGSDYTEGSANTGFFSFEATGGFVACFGNNAGPGFCAAGASSDDWYVHLFPGGAGVFWYATTQATFLGEGTVVYAAATTIPEPPVLALFGLAMAGLFLSRLHRQTRPMAVFLANR